MAKYEKQKTEYFLKDGLNKILDTCLRVLED